MRELKLKYFIDLVSNLGPKAQADAKALQQAQAVMSAAITGTNNKWLDYSKLTLLAGKNTAMMQEVITGATSRFTALDRAITQAGNNSSIERQLSYMHRLAQAVDAAANRAGTLRTALAQGLDKAPAALASGAGGYYAGRAVLMPAIRESSSLEAATTELRISMLDASGKVSKDFDKISAEATKLGNQLPGTTKDFMLAARALQTQGVPSSVVANGGLRASSYVGALLDLNQSSAAEVVAKLREAHGLKDSELVPMADLVQRAFFGFGIKPQDYLETAKYAAPTFNTMGITGLAKTRETLAIQGMAANVGLEASSFGTNYAMMLTRLSQIDPRLAKKSKEAKEAKALLGEHGINMSFYDDQGVFKGNLNMLQQLAKLRGLNPLEQTRMLHTLFGTEGGRPAQVLVQKGLEGYQQALTTIDSQGGLDARITMKMETFASKLESLSGTIQNVLAKLGRPTTDAAKKPMDAANEMLGGPISNFIESHPKTSTNALFGATGIAAAIGLRGFSSLLGRTAASVGTQGLVGSVGTGALGSTAILGGVGAAGAFAGWQGWRLASALGDLYSVNNREGVTLSADSRARLAGMGQDKAAARAMGLPMDLGAPGVLDMLTLNAPGAAPLGLNMGRSTEIKLGEGQLNIAVTVHDDRVSTTTSVARPMSLVRINGGATNPAGY